MIFIYLFLRNHREEGLDSEETDAVLFVVLLTVAIMLVTLGIILLV